MGGVDLESRPVMNTRRPLMGVRGSGGRAGHARREVLNVRLVPVPGGWDAELETDDGTLYCASGKDTLPGGAVNRAYALYQEDAGRARTKGHRKAVAQ